MAFKSFNKPLQGIESQGLPEVRGSQGLPSAPRGAPKCCQGLPLSFSELSMNVISRFQVKAARGDDLLNCYLGLQEGSKVFFVFLSFSLEFWQVFPWDSMLQCAGIV